MAPMFTHDVSLESDSPCVFNDSGHWTNGRTYHAFAAHTWCSKNPVHPYTSVYIMNCIHSWLLNFVASEILGPGLLRYRRRRSHGSCCSNTRFRGTFSRGSVGK